MDKKTARVLEISIDIALKEEIKTQCPRLMPKNSELLTGQELGCEGCRYHINCPKYLNCAIIAGCHGPLRRKEIAKILDLSINKITQIEQQAKSKFKTNAFNENKEIKFEVEKLTRLNKKSQDGLLVDIDILEALVKKYEREQKFTNGS